MNRAYDIDWDYFGNIYIYGGMFPYQLIKLNSAGVIQWTFTTNAFVGNPSNYGDFVIDRYSGSSYMCEANITPADMIKANASGNQVAYFAGNPNVDEMWRIAYNSCTHQGVIGCGNTSNTFQAATFDTNLTSVTPVNVLSTGQTYVDMALLAIDDSNAYMMTAENGITSFANTLIKCPIATLSPTAYMIPSGHHFQEVASINYTGTYTNGFNGMAKSKKYLYTYDGAKILKWNPWSGAFIGSVVVSAPDTFQCGGIALDACDNVFVGCINSVKQYDSTLTLISSLATTSAVYDVTLGIGGEVFACGDGFVSALNLFSPCSASSSFTVTANSTPSTCAGNDGSAMVTVTGGNPPFSYYWALGGQTTSSITGLAPGNYQVVVFEANAVSCSNAGVNTATISVTASSGFTGQSHTVTPITCAGNNNATATEMVSGGTTPYTFLWLPGGQTTSTITGLSPGTYTVIVKDNAGCQTIDSVNINLVNALAATPVVQNINCFGYGTITLNTSGGTQPYTYAWSTGDITASIYVYVPGTYTVTVQDANGCSITQSINVTQSLPWTISSVNVYGSCIGNNDSIVIHFSGGSSTLFFYWYDSFGNYLYGDSVITGLSSGTYICYIYDITSGCYDSISVTVGFVATVSQINPSCIGPNTGTAWVSTATGTPPYTYSWSTTPVQTTDTVVGLVPGIYTCIIIDSNGCQTIDTVTIAQLTTMPVIQNITCAGYGTITINTLGGASPYTYLWSTGDITSAIYVFAPGTYSVTVFDANGCSVTLGPLTVTAAPVWSVASVTVGNACNGNNGMITVTLSNGSSYTMYYYWYNSFGNPIGNPLDSTLSGLASGTYYCYVYDYAFCKDTTITVTISNSPFSVSISQTNSTCSNNSGTATATVISGVAPYTYYWNPTGQTTQTATGLGAGTYTVTVTDANGCTQTQPATLIGTSGPAVTASGNATITVGSSVNLNSSSNPPFVIYQWSPATGLNCTSCANPTAAPTSTTEYCVKVTDANNCTDSTCVTVTVEIPCDSILYLPNAFSPNGDGENDVLKIYYSKPECIDSLRLAIYDRWGEEVFETIDLNGTWDGNYNGTILSTQVFAYYLTVTFTDKTVLNRKGNISLVR